MIVRVVSNSGSLTLRVRLLDAEFEAVWCLFMIDDRFDISKYTEN